MDSGTICLHSDNSISALQLAMKSGHKNGMAYAVIISAIMRLVCMFYQKSF